MSFTAEVKDELARVAGPEPGCDVAELSALVHVAGSLSVRSGRYAIRLVTETGATARTVIRLAHGAFGLETRLTPRRSVLHKTRNYLIVMPEQPELPQALRDMGIVNERGGLVAGIDPAVVSTPARVSAFLRGAFLAGGFVADPRGDLHLEIAVDGEALAEGIVACARAFGVHARLNRRRNSFAVYLKSFDDMHALLSAMGAERSAELCRRVRQMKSLKNDVNRTVNAEMANQRRASHAGADQVELVRDALSLIGRDALPSSLLAFCEARIANPDLSLRDLGATMDPPASKSALYHRLLRLDKLVTAARERACAGTTSS